MSLHSLFFVNELPTNLSLAAVTDWQDPKGRAMMKEPFAPLAPAAILSNISQIIDGTQDLYILQQVKASRLLQPATDNNK